MAVFILRIPEMSIESLDKSEISRRSLRGLENDFEFSPTEIETLES